MLATLPTAATDPGGFSVTNLLAALVFVLLFWLFQRWLRERVSTRRRERWAREDGRPLEEPETPATGGSTPDGTAPEADDPEPRPRG